MALGEREGDVAGFVFEGDGGENLVGDFALLIEEKSGPGEECGGGDEPDAREEDEDSGEAGHWVEWTRYIVTQDGRGGKLGVEGRKGKIENGRRRDGCAAPDGLG